MSRLTFLYQMDLPHRAVAVYTYLHDRANKNGECWSSVNKIAGDIKLSPATVRRAIKDLRKAKLPVTEQRYRDNGSNNLLTYKINSNFLNDRLFKSVLKNILIFVRIKMVVRIC